MPSARHLLCLRTRRRKSSRRLCGRRRILGARYFWCLRRQRRRLRARAAAQQKPTAQPMPLR
jgi:hypothetical protein